jgi:hypothetical protein
MNKSVKFNINSDSESSDNEEYRELKKHIIKPNKSNYKKNTTLGSFSNNIDFNSQELFNNGDFNNLINTINPNDNYIDSDEEDDKYMENLDNKEEELYSDTSDSEEEDYILGYREYLIESGNNVYINNKIIEEPINNKIDDILDKLDINDDPLLDEIFNNLNKKENIIEEKKEEINDEEKEKKIKFDIDIAFNIFKNRYNDIITNKTEKKIYKLFDIFIRNNPDKKHEFYVNFIRMILLEKSDELINNMTE